MPDVRLPDGTIVRNVPAGTTKAQLTAKLAKGPRPVDRGGVMGSIDAGARGFTDMATFGLADKVVAGLNTILPLDKATNPNVKSVYETGDFGDAFRNNLRQEQQIAASDQRDRGFARGVGQVAGAVVGPVPGRGMLAKGAARLGKAAPVARIAGEGAIQSGLHGLGSGDSTSITQRLQQGAQEAGQGAVGSLVGAGAVKGLARGISPVVNPAVAKLAKMGVTMTPGQRAGPGVRQWLENTAESIPGVGVAIRGAKRRGLEQFNKGAINAALKPIKAVIPTKAQAGRASIEAAQEAVGNSYDQALANVNAPIDDIFSRGIAETSDSASKLPPDAAANFQLVMQRRIAPLLQGKGALDGAALQSVTRELQGFAAKADDGSIGGELLADELRAARQHFIDLAARHSPEGTDAFLRANQASANLSRIESAAKNAHGDGVFSPHQLSVATAKKGYGTTVKNAAAGKARLQDISDAGKMVLPNNVPNSGTAERGAMMAGGGALLGGGGAAINPALALPALGAAPYIPGIDKLLQKLALRGQGKGAKSLSDEIRQRAYIGGILGAPMALQVGD